MSVSKLRPILQVNLMFLVVAFAALTGWACSCFGSDYSRNLTTRDRVAGPNLMRWHDFTANHITASQKDLGYLRDWVQTGEVGFGLLIPTAPEAQEPGSLAGRAGLQMGYTDAQGKSAQFSVPLTTSVTLAERLQQASPAPAGQHWQALIPENFEWLSEVPTQTSTIDTLSGSLFYEVDFHGDDLCNHCEVRITGCTSQEFSFGEQLALQTLGLTRGLSSDNLQCAAPVPTTILLEDNQGNLQPGPTVLKLGMYGFTPYTTTTSSKISLPLDVSHTDSTTRTVLLAPIHSELGWNYAWTDLRGNPITQIEASPLILPVWANHPQPNVSIVNSSLPACTRLKDTISMTATLAMTPSVQATLSTAIQVLPDPDRCNVVDVGIYQVASTQAISAGQSITLSWTISNFTSAPVSVIVTGTFSSAQAVAGLTLPPDCHQSGTQVICQITGLPANQNVQRQVIVRTASSYNGIWSSRVHAEPLQASDDRFYDNACGPVNIVISGGTSQDKLYLPLVRQQ